MKVYIVKLTSYDNYSYGPSIPRVYVSKVFYTRDSAIAHANQEELSKEENIISSVEEFEVH